MRILVIGEMRSRTSWFMDTLSSHLGIRNLEAPYGVLHSKAVDADKWKDVVTRITGVICRDENYIAKIETTEMFLNDQYISLEYFRPENYNKIYTIKRDNLVDTFCSLYIVLLFDKWQLYKGESPKPIDLITVDQVNDLELLKKVKVIRETYNRAIDYLKKQLLPYTEIEYSNIGKWIEDNAPTGISDLISPNYNYRELFSNYDDIARMIEEA